MAGEAKVQVSQFLDDYGLGSFQIKLIVWSVLLAMIDGYDIGAIAFAAPHLIAEWHIQPKALGLVLSASNIGVLFGSQIFGWVGDRYGRKTALILSNLLFGVLTYAAAYSTDLTQLSWLRLFAGLGIGGVIPNLVAINAELAPRNLRATLAIIAAGLVPLGGALAGFVGAALVPQYGWQILFEIGGIVPIVLALAGIFSLPESIKFMTLHESHRDKIVALLAAIRPDYQVPPEARFVIEDEQQSPSSNPIYLFADGLGGDHAADLADVRLQPDGLFLSDQLDADADGRRPCAAAGGGAGGRRAASRRHRRRAGSVLVAAARALPRHRHPVRDRGAGRRLDRLCRLDLDDRTDHRDLLRRLPRARHPVRYQRRRRADLSDHAARQRLRLAARHRPARRHRRAADGRIVRRASGRTALRLVDAAVRRRRGGDVPHLTC